MNRINIVGTGFDIRNTTQEDVDDEIDVDGDDDVLFGAAQFTESDILATVSTEVTTTPSPAEDSGIQVDVDGGTEVADLAEKTLRDLVAEGKVVKKSAGEASTSTQEAKKAMEEVMGLGEAEEVDASVELARRAGNSTALIKALESKVELLVGVHCSHIPRKKTNRLFYRNLLVFLHPRLFCVAFA